MTDDATTPLEAEYVLRLSNYKLPFVSNIWQVSLKLNLCAGNSITEGKILRKEERPLGNI